MQVPPRARARLIERGHVKFAEETLRDDQFAVLVTDSLYDPEVGLLWEDAETIYGSPCQLTNHSESQWEHNVIWYQTEGFGRARLLHPARNEGRARLL